VERRLYRVLDSDVLASSTVEEADDTISLGEERIVAPRAYVFSGVEVGSSLANDDVARDHSDAVVALYAQTLSDGVATITA